MCSDALQGEGAVRERRGGLSVWDSACGSASTVGNPEWADRDLRHQKFTDRVMFGTKQLVVTPTLYSARGEHEQMEIPLTESLR